MTIQTTITRACDRCARAMPAGDGERGPVVLTLHAPGTVVEWRDLCERCAPRCASLVEAIVLSREADLPPPPDQQTDATASESAVAPGPRTSAVMKTLPSGGGAEQIAAGPLSRPAPRGVADDERPATDPERSAALYRLRALWDSHREQCVRVGMTTLRGISTADRATIELRVAAIEAEVARVAALNDEPSPGPQDDDCAPGLDDYDADPIHDDEGGLL